MIYNEYLPFYQTGWWHLNLFYKGTTLRGGPYKMLVVDPTAARILRDRVEPIEPHETYFFKGIRFI